MSDKESKRLSDDEAKLLIDTIAEVERQEAGRQEQPKPDPSATGEDATRKDTAA